MGCGASVHAQGTSPVLAGSEQQGVTEPTKVTTPAPLAEEKSAAQEPEVKDVEQLGDAQPAVGAPAPAPSPTPDADLATVPRSEPDDAQLLQSARSAGSGTPSSWGDELSPCSPAPGGPAWSDDPLPAPAPQAQSPVLRPPQSPQPPQLPPAAIGNALDDTRLVLGASTSSAVADLDRSCAPNRSSAVFDPAVTPSSGTTTVTLMPESQGGTFAGMGRARYTDESDLSIASHSYDLDGRGDDDSDEDEVASLFTLQAWKRYYNYNKRKAPDLLSYFWRKFPPKDYSCFCISYRNQELLILPYMAENCIHGYCARLEDLGLSSEVFLQMYTLHDRELGQYRVVGLLLVQGAALPPPLASLSSFDGFVYQRADTSMTLVKQFMSALLVGRSPLHSLTLVSGREVA